MSITLPFPTTSHYWLHNAHVPRSVLDSPPPPHLPIPALASAAAHEDLCYVDLEINQGIIQAIQPASSPTEHTEPLEPTVPHYILQGNIVLPCFVDMHTHLDKGHIWHRAPNPDGTFARAMDVVREDCRHHWHASDVYRRLEFGLKCSYAHGTQAIRTHIDSWGSQADISFAVFEDLQRQWVDRLTLQAVCLIPIELMLTPQGEQLADRLANLSGGVLGGLVLMHPDLDKHLDRTLQLAAERGLDLDLHADETLDPRANGLYHIAAAAHRNQFPGRITCGHCCSLSTQAPETVQPTLDLLTQADIGIVSLPLCNLYLQDRQPQRTPRYRGVTLIQELRQAGIPVALASDNCRDPFYGFGDHDMLEVLTLSVRIAHLDCPYADVPAMTSRIPADRMGLSTIARIGVGRPADLILFRGRTLNELLSRSQHDRVILRQGLAIDATLPDYAELDDLIPQP